MTAEDEVPTTPPWVCRLAGQPTVNGKYRECRPDTAHIACAVFNTCGGTFSTELVPDDPERQIMTRRHEQGEGD